jgi:hypothetical protein
MTGTAESGPRHRQRMSPGGRLASWLVAFPMLLAIVLAVEWCR